MAKRRQAARPQGLDLEPIINLLSRFGMAGNMSSPTGNPREALGRSMNQRGVAGLSKATDATAEQLSSLVSPYSISELNRMRRGDVRPSDAAWGALFAAPAAKPLKRVRGALRAGRSVARGVQTNPVGSRSNMGVTGEPSGEAQYASLNALLKLLGG